MPALNHEQGVSWESAGEGDYTVETVAKASRGTDVILHLRPDEDDLLSGSRAARDPAQVLRSHHRPDPHEEGDVGRDGEASRSRRTKTSRSTRRRRSGRDRRSRSREEQYDEFYKHVAHDFEAPLAHVHAKVEGRLEYTQLFYVPQRAPFDLWDREHRHGIKLYVRRVFIMDDAEDLMPTYLRFVRGIIDSSDLPLNVSREILQQSRDVQQIKAASVKRVLGMLEELAEKQPDKYATFWKTFGRVFKEGVAGGSWQSRPDRQDCCGSRRRMRAPTPRPSRLPNTSSRMKEGQDAIYYITADGYAAARNSPHLEIFRKHGVEVLLAYDRIDEWVVSTLTAFEGKPLQSVAKGDLDLSKLGGEAAKQASASRGGRPAVPRAPQDGARRSRQRRADDRPAHRFTVVPHQRPTRAEHQPRAHPQGGGAGRAALQAGARGESRSSAGEASEERDERGAVHRLEPHPFRPGDARRGRAARGSRGVRQAA